MSRTTWVFAAAAIACTCGACSQQSPTDTVMPESAVSAAYPTGAANPATASTAPDARRGKQAVAAGSGREGHERD